MKKTTSPKNPLPEALRLMRVFHDLSVTELAKLLDVSPAYVSLLESGKKTPNLPLIEKYARIFDTTPASILFFSETLSSKRGSTKIKTGIRDSLLKFLKAIERTHD